MSLAEASGIQKAFSEYRNNFFFMYGVERAVRNVSATSPSDLGDMLCLPRVPLSKGEHFVVLCGDRHPYQFCSGRWYYIDGIADEVHEDYHSYLQAVSDEKVRAAWDDDPTIAQRAYVEWKDYLENVEKIWDENNVDPRDRFSEVVYGIDEKPPEVKGVDPDPIYAIAARLESYGLTGAVINGRGTLQELFPG